MFFRYHCSTSPAIACIFTGSSAFILLLLVGLSLLIGRPTSPRLRVARVVLSCVPALHQSRNKLEKILENSLTVAFRLAGNRRRTTRKGPQQTATLPSELGPNLYIAI